MSDIAQESKSSDEISVLIELNKTWNGSLRWNYEMPIERWWGVSVDHEGFVVELDLNFKSLTGDLFCFSFCLA